MDNLKFGDYTRIDDIVNISKEGRRLFHVECKCGKIEFKRADYLLKGRCTSCKSCASKKTVVKYPMPVNRTGHEGLSGTHYFSIKYGAIRRGLDFNLSPEFLWNLYLKQNKLCALTGLPITLVNKIKNNNVDWNIITASVDRIDSSKGYEPNNVQWVHKEANKLKNDYSMNELVYWCGLIHKLHGNPEPNMLNDVKVGMAVQRLGGEESTNNPPTSARHLAIDDDIV